MVTFFRRGKLRKIFQTTVGGEGGAVTREVDFLHAADLLRAEVSTKRHAIGPDFYSMLAPNKAAFEDVFAVEGTIASPRGSRGSEVKFTRILRAIWHSPEFTDEDEEYVGSVLRLIEDGALPKATIKKILTKIAYIKKPLPMLAVIRSGISEEFFRPTFGPVDLSGPKEVILSGYFAGGDRL